MLSRALRRRLRPARRDRAARDRRLHRHPAARGPSQHLGLHRRVDALRRRGRPDHGVPGRWAPSSTTRPARSPRPACSRSRWASPRWSSWPSGAHARAASTPTRPRSRRSRRATRPSGPFGAAFIAAMVQGWPVVAAAVAAVLKATDSDVGRVLGILVVIVVASSTYLAAQILSGLRPERTAACARRRPPLDREPPRPGDRRPAARGRALAGRPRRGRPAREVSRPSTCRKTLGPRVARCLAWVAEVAVRAEPQCPLRPGRGLHAVRAGASGPETLPGRLPGDDRPGPPGAVGRSCGAPSAPRDPGPVGSLKRDAPVRKDPPMHRRTLASLLAGAATVAAVARAPPRRRPRRRRCGTSRSATPTARPRACCRPTRRARLRPLHEQLPPRHRGQDRRPPDRRDLRRGRDQGLLRQPVPRCRAAARRGAHATPGWSR